MSLEVIQDLGDRDTQKTLMPLLNGWYEEVRTLLPKLPQKLQIYFFEQNSPFIMEEYGVGGYAYSSEIMSLGWALDFEDVVEQKRQLRSTVFHEGLHIAQGYTGASPKQALLNCAVYEGLATVFEREFAGIAQPYGDYSAITDDMVIEWLALMNEQGTGWTDDTYKSWSIYDDATNEKWRMYRAGAWLIDQMLKYNPKTTVLDLTKMNAGEILKLKNGVKF